MADEYVWPFPAEPDPTPNEFVEWVEKNLPTGTVVHNPRWWATRIWRAAERADRGVPASDFADKQQAEYERIQRLASGVPATDPPTGTPSDARGAWTCSRCGFRGFWSGGPHECPPGVKTVDGGQR